MQGCQTRAIPDRTHAAPPVRPLKVVRTEIRLDCCWEDETSPRLLPSDLENPQRFHQRLCDWLAQQR